MSLPKKEKCLLRLYLSLLCASVTQHRLDNLEGAKVYWLIVLEAWEVQDQGTHGGGPFLLVVPWWRVEKGEGMGQTHPFIRNPLPNAVVLLQPWSIPESSTPCPKHLPPTCQHLCTGDQASNTHLRGHIETTAQHVCMYKLCMWGQRYQEGTYLQPYIKRIRNNQK